MAVRASNGLDPNRIRALIVQFCAKNDADMLNMGLDIAGLVQWTMENGVEELNKVLVKKFGRGIDMNAHLGSLSLQHKRTSFVVTPEVSTSRIRLAQLAKEKERKLEFDKNLKLFYKKHDPSKLDNVDKIVRYALCVGIDELNKKLEGKYGEGIEINVKQNFTTMAKTMKKPSIPEIPESKAATPATPATVPGYSYDPSKIRKDLARYYVAVNDPGQIEILDELIVWVESIGIEKFNEKTEQLYGISLEDMLKTLPPTKSVRLNSVFSDTVPPPPPYSERLSAQTTSSKNSSIVSPAPLADPNRISNAEVDVPPLPPGSVKTSASTIDEESTDGQDQNEKKKPPVLPPLPSILPIPLGSLAPKDRKISQMTRASWEYRPSVQSMITDATKTRDHVKSFMSREGMRSFISTANNFPETHPSMEGFDKAKMRENLMVFYEAMHDPEQAELVDDVVEVIEIIGLEEFDNNARFLYGVSMTEKLEEIEALKANERMRAAILAEKENEKEYMPQNDNESEDKDTLEGAKLADDYENESDFGSDDEEHAEELAMQGNLFRVSGAGLGEKLQALAMADVIRNSIRSFPVESFSNRFGSIANQTTLRRSVEGEEKKVNDIDESKLRSVLCIFYESVGDEEQIEVLDDIISWIVDEGIEDFNERAEQVYGISLVDKLAELNETLDIRKSRKLESIATNIDPDRSTMMRKKRMEQIDRKQLFDDLSLFYREMHDMGDDEEDGAFIDDIIEVIYNIGLTEFDDNTELLYGVSFLDKLNEIKREMANRKEEEVSVEDIEVEVEKKEESERKKPLGDIERVVASMKKKPVDAGGSLRQPVGGLLGFTGSFRDLRNASVMESGRSFSAMPEDDIRTELLHFYKKHGSPEHGRLHQVLEIAKKLGRKDFNRRLKALYGETLDDVKKEDMRESVRRSVMRALDRYKQDESKEIGEVLRRANTEKHEKTSSSLKQSRHITFPSDNASNSIKNESDLMDMSKIRKSQANSNENEDPVDNDDNSEEFGIRKQISSFEMGSFSRSNQDNKSEVSGKSFQWMPNNFRDRVKSKVKHLSVKNIKHLSRKRQNADADDSKSNVSKTRGGEKSIKDRMKDAIQYLSVAKPRKVGTTSSNSSSKLKMFREAARSKKKKKKARNGTKNPDAGKQYMRNNMLEATDDEERMESFGGSWIDIDEEEDYDDNEHADQESEQWDENGTGQPLESFEALDDLFENGPCTEYKLDMSGDKFGICQCGFSKRDHDARSTKTDASFDRADTDASNPNVRVIVQSADGKKVSI